MDLRRGAALNQHLGEGAIAAAHIDPTQVRRRRKPIKEDLSSRPAPSTHGTFVLFAISERDVGFDHWL